MARRHLRLNMTLFSRPCTCLFVVYKLDAEIAARLKGELRFYDGVAHRGIFGLAKPIRESLAAEKRIIAVENPVFMY